MSKDTTVIAFRHPAPTLAPTTCVDAFVATLKEQSSPTLAITRRSFLNWRMTDAPRAEIARPRLERYQIAAA